MRGEMGFSVSALGLASHYALRGRRMLPRVTVAGGCTHFVPGSQHLRRRRWATKARRKPCRVEAPAGSIILWDGATWHGNCSRTLPGERVVLHLTCCRQNIRPIESYDGISQDVLARNPPEFARLLRMGDRWERREMVADRVPAGATNR